VKLARDHDMDMYASLERYMKCGIGVCDSCAVDGLHVCTDGPVFSLGQLEAMGDLGKWKLDRCGARIRL
jgi:dihydroorotate dehydrogenase electron transfer subunit